MSVVHIHLRIVQVPLLKLSFFPDLKWQQFFECSFYFIHKVGDIKDLAGFQIISKQFLQNTAIHCRTKGNTMDTVIRGCKCIFRRRGWSCDEVSVIRHQISQIKFHCSPDKRKGFFSQKLSVQCITVMLPQMTAEPPRAHRPHRVGTGIFILPEISDRAGMSPDIHIMMAHPSIQMIDFFCCLFSMRGSPFNQIEQRLMAVA